MGLANAPESIMDKLRNYFQSSSDISFAFLFGSISTGRMVKGSDADIAVYLSRNCSLERIKEIWGDLETLAGRDVDLIILNRAAPLIAFAALRGTSIIIKDYALYLDYMLRTSQEAEDFSRCVFDIWNLRQKILHERTMP